MEGEREIESDRGSESKNESVKWAGVFTAVGLYLALASPTYFMMPASVPPVMNMGLRSLVPSKSPLRIASLSVFNMSKLNAPPVTEMMTCPAETCHAHMRTCKYAVLYRPGQATGKHTRLSLRLIHTYIRIHIHTHVVCMCIHTLYICICIYIYIYIYMYILRVCKRAHV